MKVVKSELREIIEQDYRRYKKSSGGVRLL